MSDPGPTGGDRLDRIVLTGLRAVGHHGVLQTERETGQIFLADVTVELAPGVLPDAAGADDLARTISYADIAEDVVAVLAGEPVDLVETLVERIAAVVLAREPVRAVEVTVHKPRAPIPVEFDDVSVSIHRQKEAPAPAAPPTAAASPRPAPSPASAAPVGALSVVERQETHPQAAEAAHMVLALGANLGEPLSTLRSAVAALRHAAGLHVSGVSPLARTAPVLGPDQEPQPDYLNAVVTGTTVLAPHRLLALVQEIEEAHGRVRGERWGARSLDIDVIAVAETVLEAPELTLPHPRAHERAFVLAPWARLDPAAELPGHGRVAELAARAPDAVGLTWVAGQWADPAGAPGAGLA